MRMGKSTRFRWPVLGRKYHRWATVVIALPFLVILVTGNLLLWKKDIAWIQPPTQQGATTVPSISFDQIMDAAQTAAKAGISSWDDVDRIDVRPDEGVAKIRSVTGWEVQVDTDSGEVLQVAYRRSDLIESIHDGTWFHSRLKLWLFFPVAIVLLILYLTGIYLFYLPYKIKWKRSRDARSRAGPTA